MTNKIERDSVFISYSHEDTNFLNKLKRHFSIFKGKFDVWDDSKIMAGEKWKEKILQALDRSKIAILLVSADFLNSRFISEIELPTLLKATENEGGVIISIIVKPCLFNEYPEISQFQAINPPSNALSQMSESEQESIFVNLALRVKELMAF